VLGDSELLMPEDLNLAPVDPSMLPQTDSDPLKQEYRELSLAELEREHIQSTLEHTEGNKSAAAKILGIERSTLDRKLKRY
jgi:Nif-specific regulatory protein